MDVEMISDGIGGPVPVDGTKLLPVTDEDRAVAEAIVSGARGYAVKLPNDGHSAIQLVAQHRLSTRAAPPAMDREAVEKLVQPWADYDGDLPDYDHPLRPVYESGIEYAVQLLAKELGVDEWQRCDGTEEFDGDLGGTLMNIVLEAMPKDKDGDPIHPRDLLSILSADAIRQGEGKYLVWSIEHAAWWAPNEMGYTSDINGAGRYDRDAALAIVHRPWGWDRRVTPDEMLILERDAIDLATPASHASDGGKA